jgi:hypothetical protein
MTQPTTINRDPIRNLRFDLLRRKLAFGTWSGWAPTEGFLNATDEQHRFYVNEDTVIGKAYLREARKLDRQAKRIKTPSMRERVYSDATHRYNQAIEYLAWAEQHREALKKRGRATKHGKSR